MNSVLAVLLLISFLFYVISSQKSPSFNAPAMYSTTYEPYDLAAGDMNNDGFVDLVLGHVRGWSIFYGIGNGAFSQEHVLDGSGAIAAVFLTLGDLDNNGTLDIVISSYATAGPNTLQVWLNNGAGNFTNNATHTLSNQIDGVRVGDFDKDGNLDAVLCVLGTNQVAVFLNSQGNGVLSPPTFYNTSTGPKLLSVDDFNLDQKLDLVVAAEVASQVDILLGTGSGTFPAYTAYAAGSTTYDAVSGRFNADGFPDVAASSYDTDSVGVFLNDGTGALAASVNSSLPSNFGPYRLGVGDVNVDGSVDIVVGGYKANQVAFLLNDGTGNFTKVTLSSCATGPYGLVVQSLDGDGSADIAIAGSTDNSIWVFLNKITTTPAPTTPHPTHAPTTPGITTPTTHGPNSSAVSLVATVLLLLPLITTLITWNL